MFQLLPCGVLGKYHCRGIGSASKRAAILRDLRNEGITDDLLEKITCPLGLPIGDNDPHEIAAQLLEKRGSSKWRTPSACESPRRTPSGRVADRSAVGEGTANLRRGRSRRPHVQRPGPILSK
jgi:hypothetical protein